MANEIHHFEHENKLDKCPACLSSEISEFVVGEDYHYGIEGVFSTDKCTSCGTVFINPMPSAKDLSALYPDDYYSYQTPTVESAARRVARTVLRYPRVYSLPHFDQPGTMVDVGCGAGHYLLEMKRRGWTVFGAEPSRSAAEAGRRAGIEIRVGELTDAGFEDQKFDFVRSNHSFEHISNPDEILQEMRRILKDDGKMFLGIPNFGGMWPSMYGKYWWNFGLPVHAFNYTVKGITAALERNGFKVERVVHNSDYSGLTGSMQIKANARAGQRRSDGSIISNKILRMPAHYLSKLMDLLKRGDCIEVIASKKF